MIIQDEKILSSMVTYKNLLIHGPVELGSGWHRKKRHLFLFRDYLLIANTRYIYPTSSPDYYNMHFQECGFSLIISYYYNYKYL
jgi:hypothetical protein